MRRLLAILAVALPVAGTLMGIAWREAELRGATEWRIPITGFDPGDPLRGRYIAFRYLWEAHGDPALCGYDRQCALCLENGGAGVLVAPRGMACPAAVDAAASGLSVFRGTGTEAGRVSAATRVWVPEAAAPTLDRQLRTRPMVAVARLTRSGRLVAERLEPAR